jgi:hypothetical protein
MHKEFKKAIAVAVSTLLTVVSGSAPAWGELADNRYSKAPDYTYYNLKHYSDRNCLDSDGRNVYTKPCKGGNVYQMWRITPSKSGYNIIHRPSGNCLTAGGGDLVFMADAFYCPADNSQWERHWKVGTWPNVAEDTCLDGNSVGEVYHRPCTPDNPHQRWYAIGT